MKIKVMLVSLAIIFWFGISIVSAKTYWAILVCGSDDFKYGFETDIRDMYKLLRKELGYDDDHIYYVAPSNWNGAKHYYSLSKSNIKKAIHDVANRSSSEDSVFFFYTGHGYDTCSIDPNISPIELDTWLDAIDPHTNSNNPRKCDQMVILLQACHSGCFIQYLWVHPHIGYHSKRIILTSTDDVNKSYEDMKKDSYWVGDPCWDPNRCDDDGANNPTTSGGSSSSAGSYYDGSEFSSGFRMAFRDFDNDGYFEADDKPYRNNPLNYPASTPDITPPYGNRDTKVSVQEAFNFSKFEDCYSVYWKSYVQNAKQKLEYPQQWSAFCGPYAAPCPGRHYASGIDPSKTYIYDTSKLYTSTGMDVILLIENSTITFTNVTSEGYTTVVSQTTNPKGAPPTGFRLRGHFVDVSTTAEYEGPITVCINYTGIIPEGGEGNLRLMHWTGSIWEDVTTSLDTENNIICGQVSHLSWFGLASYSPAVGGVKVSVNKAELVVPYIIAWILACIAIAGIYLSKRR